LLTLLIPFVLLHNRFYFQTWMSAVTLVQEDFVDGVMPSTFVRGTVPDDDRQDGDMLEAIQ
jgi:hypothetical protein